MPTSSSPRSRRLRRSSPLRRERACKFEFPTLSQFPEFTPPFSGFGASPVAGDGDGEGVGGGEVGSEGLEDAAVGAHVDHGEAALLFKKIIEFVIEIIPLVNR